MHVVAPSWPALPPYGDWSETCDTLHAHTQLLGKLAARLAPPEPELQHAALRLTARGWETEPLPAPDGSGALTVALDLHARVALVEHSAGASVSVALVLGAYRASYRGRKTPVNAWWGSFDLSTNLFSGAPAEPPAKDFITRNSMDAEEVAVGWWPGDARYSKAAFYAYAHPAPEGFGSATLEPSEARWEQGLGLYVLDWDDARASADPHATAVSFARSAFRHACAVCGWDQALSGSADGVPPPVT